MKTSRRDSYGFTSSPVWTWELDGKEAWAGKNWCFHTVVLEKTLEVLLDSMKIKPLSPKGNKLWIFVWRTNAEAEAPVLWSPDVKSWLPGKDPDAGKDWRWDKKGLTEDEMIGWYCWLNGHEFEQTLEIVKDRKAWRAAVHGVTKSRTWLSAWTTTGDIPNKVKKHLNTCDTWKR